MAKTASIPVRVDVQIVDSSDLRTRALKVLDKHPRSSTGRCAEDGFRWPCDTVQLILYGDTDGDRS